jgi:hypothetical protein
VEDFVAVLVLGHVRGSGSGSFIRSTTSLRVEPVQPHKFGGHQPVRRLHHLRFGIEHVEHVARLDAGAAADLEVVEIMPGVIFTAPLPSSGSACSSATTLNRRPVSGWTMSLPITLL